MRQTLRKWNTRLLAVCMAVLLILCHVPVTLAAGESGQCGANLTWSFADGRLTISGSGDMTDFNQADLPPWYAFREQILYLSLPEGLTSIGNMAFYDCANLTAISIPSTVTDIGKLAFCQCRSVQNVKLNEGLRSIGRNAFEQCESLRDLRLPGTLTTIGYHAFYRCTSLRYVTVPASVSQLDEGVFAHCDNLIRVEVEAPIETIPSWTFYDCDSLTSITLSEQTTATEVNAFSGCGKLNTVYYPGAQENADQLREQIGADEENFQHYGTVTAAPPENTDSVSETIVDANGQLIAQNTTVTKTESATISTTTNQTVSNSGNSVSTQITATVLTQEGWQQLLDTILAAQSKQENESANVKVDVYVTGSSELPQNVINSVAGSNVNMTVQTESGSKFAVNGTVLEGQNVETPLELSYVVAWMSKGDYPELANATAYKLRFHNSSDIKVEVMIRVPAEHARKVASLYQSDGDKLVLLQNVMVDAEGYAHFYLASVNKDTDYRIGIDVKDIDKNSVIIPENLYAEYGITEAPAYMDYVITGRSSSWGVSSTQVTLILMGVMVFSAAVVGVFMYLRNKKKLRDGYVPELDEEDLQEE